MLNVRTARMFADYKTWADDLLFDAVGALPPPALVRERPTLFKTMIATLNHNYVIDVIWQAHLQGRDHGLTARNGVPYPQLADLKQAQEAMNAWLRAWAATQTDATLGETVHFTYVSGEAGAMTRGQMLLHLVNHASYHRGWVCEMFFDIPARPPVTDLPVFLAQSPIAY